MTFPNAAKGVKKYFNAEIMVLIATAVTIVSAIVSLILAIVAGSTGDEGAAVAGGIGVILLAVFLLASMVILSIAFILQLVGLRQAGKDESSFKTAFWFIILSLAAAVALGVLSLFLPNRNLDKVSSAVSMFTQLMTIIYVITGIRTLAVSLQNETIAARGQSILNFLTVMLIIALVANFTAIFFRSGVMQIIAAVLCLVAGVLKLIVDIRFLFYLGAGAKMLANE